MKLLATSPQSSSVSALRASHLSPLGNVVVIPGLMGSSLAEIETDGTHRPLWLNIPRLALGALGRLPLLPDGQSLHDIRPTGILTRYYGPLLAHLARRYRVRGFWFDWRRDAGHNADLLHASINTWFGPDAPVHLVAHSMGGLIARQFQLRHPDHWTRMWDPGTPGRPPGTQGGRLVMLGTPNHGAYLIVHMLTGLAATMRRLARVDLVHDLDTLRQIATTFTGILQMLPDPVLDPAASPLYETARYNIPSFHSAPLIRARQSHDELRPIIDPDRLTYIAGYNQPTLACITNPDQLTNPRSYRATRRGDGSVCHTLGLLPGVTTYFVEQEHSALPSDPRVLDGLDAILTGNLPERLAGTIPSPPRRQAGLESCHPGRTETPAEQESLALALHAQHEACLEHFSHLLANSRPPGLTGPESSPPLS